MIQVLRPDFLLRNSVQIGVLIGAVASFVGVFSSSCAGLSFFQCGPAANVLLRHAAESWLRNQGLIKVSIHQKLNPQFFPDHSGHELFFAGSVKVLLRVLSLRL